MPLYNYGDLVGEALGSICKQTYNNLDIIVVDDYSSDNGSSVVSKIAQRDKRIRLVQHQHNMGLSAARNTGFAHAKGQYVCLLDPDDWYTPDKTERQVAFMLANPNTAMLYGSAHYQDKIIGNEPFDCTKLITQDYIPCQAVMIDKVALAIVGGNDLSLKYAEDWEHWLRLAAVTQAVCSMNDDVPVYHIRTHDSYRQRSGHPDKPPFDAAVAQRGAIYQKQLQKTPRRITHIIPDLNRGGAQMVLYYILQAMPNSEWEITIITHSNGILGEIIKKEVPHINIITTAYLTKSISEFLSAQDVIHIHDWGDTPASEFGKAVMYTLGSHNVIVSEHSDQSVKNIPPNVRVVGTYNKYEHSPVMGEYFPSHINIVNGVATTTPSTKDRRNSIREQLALSNKKVIITISKFATIKGGDIFMDVCEYLAQKYPRKYAFIFIGAHPSHDCSSDCITRADILSNQGEIIHLFSSIPTHEVYEYLAASDIFFMPSRTETQCLALLEALAVGLPCVVSTAGGMARVIRPPDIALPSDSSPAKWAAALCARLKKPNTHTPLPPQHHASTMGQSYRWLYYNQLLLRRLGEHDACRTQINW